MVLKRKIINFFSRKKSHCEQSCLLQMKQQRLFGVLLTRLILRAIGLMPVTSRHVMSVSTWGHPQEPEWWMLAGRPCVSVCVCLLSPLHKQWEGICDSDLMSRLWWVEHDSATYAYWNCHHTNSSIIIISKLHDSCKQHLTISKCFS
jgi:hypothetical protein